MCMCVKWARSISADSRSREQSKQMSFRLGDMPIPKFRSRSGFPVSSDPIPIQNEIQKSYSVPSLCHDDNASMRANIKYETGEKQKIKR